MSSIALQELDTQHVDPPLGLAEESAADKVQAMRHSVLRADEFWRRIPGFAHVTAAEFHTHTFQARYTATNIRQIKDLLGNRPRSYFLRMLRWEFSGRRWRVRISPYLLESD